MAFDEVGGVMNSSEANKENNGLTPSDKKVWVVVMTKPQQERLARLHLERKGFEPYLPLRMGFDRKRQAITHAPFFPGYVFARTGLLVSEFAPIWHTEGVKGILGHSLERPIGVKDVLVDGIRAHEEAGFIKIGLEQDGPRFERGQKVRADGYDIELFFMERVDAKRAMLLASFLGRDSRFVVDIRKLRATD